MYNVISDIRHESDDKNNAFIPLSKITGMINENKPGNVMVMLTEKNILLKMKKNEQDISFLKSLGYLHWNATAFCRVIPKYVRNVTECLSG